MCGKQNESHFMFMFLILREVFDTKYVKIFNIKMYYKSRLDLDYLLFITVVAVCAANAGVYGCWGPSATNIGLMTGDQRVLDGNEFSIECSVNNNTIEYNKTEYKVNSSMISFKFNNKYYREDRIGIINSTAARLVVDKASVADNGLYLCMLNISDLDHHPLVCVSHVTVGYKPQAVTDFKCISWHYRRLHCSWTPPPNPINTGYTLVDKMHPNTTSEYLTRSCGISTENSCEWTTDSIPPYRNTALEFNLVLKGQNSFGNNSQLFVVNHYSIIKPNVPKDFKALKATQNKITLEWKAPDYIEYDEELLEYIMYEIRYFGSIGNNTTDHKTQTIIIDGIFKLNHILNDLKPFIAYNISIRCKTVQSKSDQYWSDFSSILITTQSDVPYLAPELIPESYQTDKNMEGMRSITLFWKHIPVEDRNGKDFRYAIEFREKSNRRERATNLLDDSYDGIESQNTTYTFHHMKSNIAYTFKLYGINSEGVSTNYSQITVERNDIIPHKPTNIDVYSFGGGRYEVQWFAPRNNPNSGSVVNYTVFWCQNLRPRPFPCEGAIDWIHTNNRSIALELADIRTNYQFAVSANAMLTSSGMSWAECVVPIDGRLDKLSDVRAHVYNSTAIVITWKLGCPAQKRVVDGYKIKFCKAKSCKSGQNVNVSNSAESYVLNGLTPFSVYKISVLAFSDFGPSEESDPILVQTTIDSPEDAPSDLRANETTSDSITLWWRPPLKKNGLISHYNIRINLFIHRLDAKDCSQNGCSMTIRALDSYSLINISVSACNTDSLCSPEAIITSRTLVSHPFRMDPPRTEVINSTSVRISWSPPPRPNGPIDYYMLSLIRANNTTDYYKIPRNQSQFSLTLDCDSSAEHSAPYRPQYAVKLSAVNIGSNETKFISEWSESTSLNACLFAERHVGYIIGMVVGGAVGFMIFVLVLVTLIRWMKRRINTYNSLDIDLPKGLEVPQLGTERDNSEPFNPFGRTDSIPNITLGTVLSNCEDDDSFKNRHGSGISHTSNSSTEGLIYKNQNLNQTTDAFFRMVSTDSGQHGSLSSGAEAHISSDSGVEIDINQQIVETIETQHKVNTKPELPILDEISLRNSDSSGDSGLHTSNGARSKRKRKPKNTKNALKISSIVMPTKHEVINPLYDNTLSHSVCIYSLLANSEPSLFDLPFRSEDDNILSDTSKYTKPEMAKSLTNIIQSCSPSEHKVNCIICETNSCSKGSTRVTSPNCPYYKYGIKRQNHFQPNYVPNFSPEKRNKINVIKGKDGYITIDSIGQTVLSKPKKRLEHDWSQNSYDAEVSSTSSNGDNEQTDPIPHELPFLPFPQSSLNGCEKIQNNSLVDIQLETDLNSISTHSVNPLNDTTVCETQLSAITEPKCSPSRVLPKDSNGYVLHNALSQLSANQMKPKLFKSSNGYVVIDGNGIEMNDFVPKNVSHMTPV